MTRKTIKEYYDLIASEANNRTELLALEPNPDSAQTFLNDITSVSKVAEHRFWIWIMAFISWVLDTMQVQHESEIANILSAGRYGTFPYYVETSLAFQLGDAQEFINDEFVYPEINDAKRIVKYADASGKGKLVNIKIAKDLAGLPVKLTDVEKSAFESYFSNHEVPGITYSITSTDPDLMKLELDIIYNPQLLTSSGILISDNTTKPVEIALQSYLNQIKFNSKFETVDLIDYLQSAAGVVRPYIVSAEAKPSGGTYSDIDRNYQPIAGYIIIDPANPVTINYISNV